MPSQANVVLNDAESTPVAHTFTPRGLDPQTRVARWHASTGVPIADEILTISYRDQGTRHKAKAVITDPVVSVETINGVSKSVILRSAYLTIEATFDDESTEQERMNTIALGKDLLSDPAFTASFIDLEPNT